MRNLLPEVRCLRLSCMRGKVRFFHSTMVAPSRRRSHARFVPLESRNHILLDTEPAWDKLIHEIEEFLPVSPDHRTALLLDELTSREREVLELVAQGLGNIKISSRLKIADKTVRNHVSIILSKLGAESRAQAVAIARDAGFGRRTIG